MFTLNECIHSSSVSKKSLQATVECHSYIPSPQHRVRTAQDSWVPKMLGLPCEAAFGLQGHVATSEQGISSKAAFSTTIACTPGPFCAGPQGLMSPAFVLRYYPVQVSMARCPLQGWAIPVDSAGSVLPGPVWTLPGLAPSGKTSEPFPAARRRSRAHPCGTGGRASASAWPQACPSPAVSANTYHPSLAGRQCPEQTVSSCMPPGTQPQWLLDLGLCLTHAWLNQELRLQDYAVVHAKYVK